MAELLSLMCQIVSILNQIILPNNWSVYSIKYSADRNLFAAASFLSFLPVLLVQWNHGEANLPENAISAAISSFSTVFSPNYERKLLHQCLSRHLTTFVEKSTSFLWVICLELALCKA